MTPLPDAYHIVPQSSWDIALLLALTGGGIAAWIGIASLIDWMDRL